MKGEKKIVLSKVQKSGDFLNGIFIVPSKRLSQVYLLSQFAHPVEQRDNIHLDGLVWEKKRKKNFRKDITVAY